MNKTLFLYEMKKSVKMLLVFVAILTMYAAIIIWMYNPDIMKSLELIYESMPQVMAAAGMNITATTLTGFMVSYLYGFILLVFPMIFSILRSKSLIADKVEKKTMVGLLSAPVSRHSVCRTQIALLVSEIFGLIAYTTAIELVLCQVLFPNELDISKLLILNVGLLAIHYMIGGICMLCSAAFNSGGTAIGVSGGITAIMFLLQMLRNTGLSDETENLKYFTFFTLYDVNGILDGDKSTFAGLIILAAAGTVMYILADAVFSHRDLPL